MISVDLMSLWAFVCSVLLCSSVRNRTHPRYEMTHKQLAGEVFLSQSAQSSRSVIIHVPRPHGGGQYRKNHYIDASQLSSKKSIALALTE